MIGDREQVYENIRTAVSLNQLNSKVEPGDPKLLREDKENGCYGELTERPKVLAC